jgi:hypothetical protein
MAKNLRSASWTDGQRGGASRGSEESEGACRALELVAMRGADVLGVRHVLEGGRCWVGPSEESIVRIPMGDYGGQAALVAEVVAGQCLLHVPPRARGRTHGKDGLGRLVMGPVSLEVKEGDHAVLVLGAVQIRARVVPVEARIAPATRMTVEVRRWLTVMAALYVTALAATAMLAPERPERLANGGIRRALGEVTERLASVNGVGER